MNSAAASRPRYLAAVFAYGAFTGLPQITAAALALLFARRFSLADFGIYGILTALLYALSFANDFGLPQAIIRFYPQWRTNQEGSRKSLSTVVYGSAILLLLIQPAAYLVLHLFWNILGLPAAVPLGLILAVAYFDRIAEIFGAVSRAIEEPRYFAVNRVAMCVTTITTSFIFVFPMKLGLTGALLGMLTGKMVAALASRIVLRRVLSLRLAWADPRALRDCLRFGLPLVPDRIAIWVRSLALRPVLTALVPLASVGLFSFASSVANFPTLVSNAFDVALSPVYFRKRTDGSGAFSLKVSTLNTAFVALLFPAWATFILFSPEIIDFFTRGRYDGAVTACSIMMCASFARIQLPLLIRQVHYLRMTWVLPVIALPCSLIPILLSVLLVARLGINGAASFVLLSELCILVVLAMVIRRFEKLDYPLLTGLFLLAALIALAVWTGAGQPAYLVSRILVKIGLVIVLATIAFWLWLWPARHVLKAIVKARPDG